MVHQFKFRHAIVIAVVVCLLSIFAGAVLAQDEPDLPEPEIPVFDLTGAEAEPVEPDLPEPEIPVFDLSNTDGSAQVTTAPTNLNPFGVVLVTDPTYTWNAVTGSNITYDFQLYGGDAVKSLTGTGLYTIREGFAPTADLVGLTNTSLDTLTSTAPPVSDGVRYIWRVRARDIDGPGPWEQAAFIVDVPRVFPENGQSIVTTSPLVSWLPVPTVQFYNLQATARAITPTSNSESYITWDNWYAGADIPASVYGVPFTGVCKNSQCKVVPDAELVPQFDFLDEGDIEVTLRIRYYIPNATNTGGTITEWQDLTTFTVIQMPGVRAIVNGAGQGRPSFVVEPLNIIEENIEGLQFPANPDYYRIVTYSTNTVANSLFGVVDQWFELGTCESAMTCTLVPVSGEHKLHYGGDFQVYSRAYTVNNNSFSRWSLGNQFQINRTNTPLPAASNLLIAGLYDGIGPDLFNPDPTAPFEQWSACDGLTATSVEPACSQSRPILHFQPNVGGFSGEWFNVVIYNRQTQTADFNQWFNVNDVIKGDIQNVYWECRENTGALPGGGWQFEPLTCFFQPGVFSVEDGLAPGSNYTWYLSSYGPMGQATGSSTPLGTGYTRPDADGDPNSIANFRIKGAAAPAGLAVSIETGEGITADTGAVNYILGEAVFSWNAIPSANYYQLEVTDPNGKLVSVGGIVDGWYAIGSSDDTVRCVNGVCSIIPQRGSNFFLLNGTYSWRVRYWNGGISEWSDANTFIVTVGAAQAVELNTMQVFLNETIEGTITPVFRWRHVQNNTWYNLRVLNAQGKDVWETIPGSVPGLWYRAYDICKLQADNTVLCEVRPSLNNFLSSGQFNWKITSFSPSLSQEESQQASFTVSNTATGALVPLYPATASGPFNAAGITSTSRLELYFERANNASWYNIVVLRRIGAGQYAEPVVADWFYLPEVGEYQYPADALNRCGGTFSFGKPQQTVSGDNICRIIPTQINEDGLRVPLTVFYNGTYEWYVRAYGPSGFATSDPVAAWRGPYTFQYNIPRSQAVDVTTIRNQDGESLNGTVVNSINGLQWDAVEIVEWYQIEIYNAAPDGTLGEPRMFAAYTTAQAGCDPATGATVCQVDIPGTEFPVGAGPFGSYYVRVVTWARPNGFTEPLWQGPPEGEQQYALFTNIPQ